MWGGQLLLIAAGLAARARGQAQMLRLSGACDYLNFLNGLEFEMRGTTASGAPWYKARTQEYFIYHDPACAGSHDGTPRWIIDNDQPSTTATKDLDGDGDCSFHAYVDSGSVEPPPASDWRMVCNGQWQAHQLQLQEIQPGAYVSGAMTTTVAVTTPAPVAYMLEVDGACHYINYLNGMIFKMEGHTASGAPYYKSTTAAYYIYYDPDCSGVTQGFSRWIIDDDQPSLYKTEDLDNDHDCVYQARVEVNSMQTSEPPRSAMWMMQCPGWQEHRLTLVQITTTSTSTRTTVTSTTKTVSSTTTSATTTSITRTATSTGTSTTTKLPATSTTATAAPTTSTMAATTAALAASTAAQTTTAAAAGPVNQTTPATCAGFACPATMVARPNASVPSGAQADSATCCMPSTASPASTTAAASVEATTTALVRDTTVEGTLPATTTMAPSPATTTIGAPPSLLRLSGVCSEKAAMDGMIFELQGRTKSGAPYYKARGESQYIYYDPDCKGDNMPARWIIDANAPSTDRSNDLDNDGGCVYHARMITANLAMPPKTGTWRMHCGSSWQNLDLTLAEVDASALPTTTAHSGHSGHGGHSPAATTTGASQAALMGSSSLVLQGGCQYMESITGLIFTQEGTTASGAPWYKASGKEFYIYYDPDCGAAGASGVARWILDNDRPSATLAQDLDGDGDCNYLARLDSTSTARPPASAQWTMYCGSSGFKAETMTLEQEYVQITTGSCADIGRVPIKESGACAAAAASMGLAASTPVTISSSLRPEGCSWDVGAGELQLAPNAANRGNGARGDLHPLCKLEVQGGDSQAAISAAEGLRSHAVLALLVAFAALTAHR